MRWKRNTELAMAAVESIALMPEGETNKGNPVVNKPFP